METYDFGIRLRDLRTKRKLSQSDVASRLDVTKSTISAYENNIAIPPSDVLKKLALMFNVSSDFLLGLDNRESLLLPHNLESRKKDLINRFLDLVINETDI